MHSELHSLKERQTISIPCICVIVTKFIVQLYMDGVVRLQNDCRCGGIRDLRAIGGGVRVLRSLWDITLSKVPSQC